jgi:glycosyltransferase involved in cell wall biosynthesis
VTLRGPRLRNKRHLLPSSERIAMNPHRAELVDALRILGVDHVHIQSIGGFGLFATEWVRYLPEALGCEYDMTLHDYAPVCPRLHFNLPDGHYCGEPPVSECERCIALHGGPSGYHPMWRWRTSWAPLMEGARRVFCACGDVAERTARYFPDARYCVRPHPERVPAKRYRGPRSSRGAGEPLRVAVPGAIGEQKGFELLIECARDARKRKLPLEFRVVGYTMSDARAEEAGVEVLGRYRPVDAERVLAEAECDLAFLPSFTPETWCFTLSSVFRVELFPVVFDIGALAERVRNAKWGEVLPVDLMRDAQAVNDRLLSLDIPPAPGDLQDQQRASTYSSFLDEYYDLPPGSQQGASMPPTGPPS